MLSAKVRHPRDTLLPGPGPLQTSLSGHQGKG